MNPEDDHLGTAWVDSLVGVQKEWLNGQETINLGGGNSHIFFDFHAENYWRLNDPI